MHTGLSIIAIEIPICASYYHFKTKTIINNSFCNVLRATGVCSQIRDSSRETAAAAAAAARPDVDGGGSGGGGASDSAASTRANAHLIHEERSGKMLVQATEHIVEGAEIVCDWGERRIRNTAPSAADYSADTSAASAA